MSTSNLLESLWVIWYSIEEVTMRLSGRGGIGRRAALRSLWWRHRGSSSLLDRTIQALVERYPVLYLKAFDTHEIQHL